MPFSETPLEQLQPFSEQPALCTLDGLTIQNNQNRLSFYGSLNITQDQQGLKLAKQMQALLDHVVDLLAKQPDLPEKIDSPLIEDVDNPFL